MQKLYPERKLYELSIYDIHIPGIAERLHRERAAWQGRSDIKALDENHFALTVRPGGALGARR
jgi:hypothetical protein